MSTLLNPNTSITLWLLVKSVHFRAKKSLPINVMVVVLKYQQRTVYTLCVLLQLPVTIKPFYLLIVLKKSDTNLMLKRNIKTMQNYTFMHKIQLYCRLAVVSLIPFSMSPAWLKRLTCGSPFAMCLFISVTSFI